MNGAVSSISDQPLQLVSHLKHKKAKHERSNNRNNNQFTNRTNFRNSNNEVKMYNITHGYHPIRSRFIIIFFVLLAIGVIGLVYDFKILPPVRIVGL